MTNVPSKVEVMGWNPQRLADYMRKLKFSGCDRVVMKGSLTGAQFLHMTECDLEVFPTLYFPILTKIQSEINRGEQKKGFSYKLKAQNFLKQVFVKEEICDSDEFDSEPDYEDPDEEEGEESYIGALAEPQTAEQLHSDRTDDGNYKPPATADTMKPPQPPRAAKLQECHRDPYPEPSATEINSKPPLPQPPNINWTSYSRPFKAPASADQPTLHIDRSRKPRQPGTSQKDLPKLRGSAVEAPGSSTAKLPRPRAPKRTDPPKRPSKLIPAPPVPTQPAKALDSSWYGGNMSRQQAEISLREVNKDGAFVVRDSSKGSAEHPYTLMLLIQDKVYNIKIRNQGNSYSLGNGLNNNKSFPGVKEMITHHTHTPLLLIDATDQSSEDKSQCCLLHPAGL